MKNMGTKYIICNKIENIEQNDNSNEVSISKFHELEKYEWNNIYL